jgi:hypothetical protein
LNVIFPARRVPYYWQEGHPAPPHCTKGQLPTAFGRTYDAVTKDIGIQTELHDDGSSCTLTGRNDIRGKS